MAPLGRRTAVASSRQHGDEPAGTEALIVAAQHLADGRFDRILEQIDVFLLPRANPDGVALGQRATADGTDLNRDHLLLRTPEAQAEAALLRGVAPLVVLDLHEYPVDATLWSSRFGAVQRFDALLQYATTANMPPFVTKAAEEWFRVPLAQPGHRRLQQRLVPLGLRRPRRSQGVDGRDRAAARRNANGLKNAVSLLVETPRRRHCARTRLQAPLQPS